MKVGRNGVETTTDPMTVAEFVAPYLRLKRLMDVGAIDAENFYESGSHFSSAYIQTVADAPTKSKYFEGHYFDQNSGSEAETFLSNHLQMIGAIGDEEIVYTVDVDVTHQDNGTSIKTSEAREEWRRFKKKSKSFWADFNFFGSRTKANQRVYDRKKSIKERYAVAKQWARQAFDKNFITIPIPEGYRYVDISHYGAIFAKITLKRVKVNIFPVSKTRFDMVFEVSLYSDTAIEADEAYSYQGKLSVKFARKI